MFQVFLGIASNLVSFTLSPAPGAVTTGKDAKNQSIQVVNQHQTAKQLEDGKKSGLIGQKNESDLGKEDDSDEDVFYDALDFNSDDHSKTTEQNTALKNHISDDENVPGPLGSLYI